MVALWLLAVGPGCEGDSDGSEADGAGIDLSGEVDARDGGELDVDSDLRDTIETADETGGIDTTDAVVDADVTIPALREPGVRAPLTRICDPSDPARCLLPWPSDSFMRLDPDTTTGVRVEVEAESLGDYDDPSALNRADGFSRVSPVVTVFTGELDADTLGDHTDGALRVLVSEPGVHLGELAPVRFNLIFDQRGDVDESTIVAYPRRPFRAASEHVVVVLDTLRRVDNSAVEPDRMARVALGLEPPATGDEAQHFAYHNPSRLALAEAGIEAEEVVRLWSFSSRSIAQPLEDLQTVRVGMLGVLEAGGVGVEIDEVTVAPRDTVAMVVLGRLTGLPNYRDDSGGLGRDEQGSPSPDGFREAPFRVAVPVGEGDYRIVMYAHGMGGDVTDGSFDDIITGEGAAKVGIQFDDWTELGMGARLPSFAAAVSAGDGVAGGFVEAVAQGITIQYALDTVLGDLLAAPTIGAVANPAQGRRPNLEIVVWAGGSLGGTAGSIYAGAEPTLQAAVINVPGAGHSHYLRYSMLYPILELVLLSNVPRLADVELAIAMAQTSIDPGDGAVWIDAADPPPVYLIQQSIGDPVLPNIGSDLVAATTQALQIGAVLHPVVDVTPAEEAVDQTGFTQFHVDSEDAYDIHGFAAGNSPAGLAAREQIQIFIRGAWAGEAHIVVPQLCVENIPSGSCDFSGEAEE